MVFSGVFPANKFVPSPYGLFSVANVTRHAGRDEHWAGGYGFDSEICDVEGSVIDICGGDPLVFLEPDAADPDQKIRPFGIRARDECLTPGFDVIDRKARIVRQLEAFTEKGVETELWNGTYAQSLDALAPPNKFLSSSDAVDVSGGGVGVAGSAQRPKIALALLEQALAQCGPGSQGIIHVPHSVGALLYGSVEQVDGKLQTLNGNLVSVGTGYDGRGPGWDEGDGTPSWFTPWMYATGPVDVHLGPSELVTPDFGSAVNPRTNVMSFVAVRPASVYWDGCCHFAVQVDIRL